MTTPLLLDANGIPIQTLEDFIEFKEEMRWFTLSTFELSMDITAQGATDIAKGLYIWAIGAEEVYLIEQIEDKSEDDNPDQMTRVVWGSLAGLFGERVVIPAVGQTYDAQTGPAETLLKHYVNANAGLYAAFSRRVPNLVVEADLARGSSLTSSARYNTLADLLTNIAIPTGLGWTTKYNTVTREFVFSVMVGADRGASVVFSREFANIANQGLLQTDVGRKTFAFVGGQGEGADRSIVQAFLGLEPTGLARREFFVDARDLDAEQETAGALVDRGAEKLQEAQPEDALEIEVDPYTNFQFGKDYFLGDIVGLRDDRLDYNKVLRVVEVTRLTNDEGEMLTLALDRPYPTLRDKTRAQAASLGSRAGDDAVIDYPKTDLVFTPWFARKYPDGHGFAFVTDDFHQFITPVGGSGGGPDYGKALRFSYWGEGGHWSFNGPVHAPVPTLDTHIAIKSYVDGTTGLHVMRAGSTQALTASTWQKVSWGTLPDDDGWGTGIDLVCPRNGFYTMSFLFIKDGGAVSRTICAIAVDASAAPAIANTIARDDSEAIANHWRSITGSVYVNAGQLVNAYVWAGAASHSINTNSRLSIIRTG